MWTILEVPPQPFGECSICKRHDCGEYKTEDGETKQKWLHTPIEMDRGGQLYIGYNCGKSMCDEFGLSKQVVKETTTRPPTDDEVLAYIRSSVDRKQVTTGADPLQANIDYINGMDRAALKAYLAEQKIEFVAQWGDDKLKETAIAHVKGAKL